MRTSSLIVSLLTAAALAPGGMAIAADYEPPVVEIGDPVEEYVPVEIGSGWYLRGDVGYAFAPSPSGQFTYRTFDPLTATYGQSNFATGDISTNVTFGAGVGYRFTDWLRADVTIDGFRARFDGTTTSGTPCIGTPAFAGTSCRSEDSARFSVMSLMANGYADLGTVVGFTPYIGAGIGYSLISFADLTNNVYCVGATCPVGYVGTSAHGGVKDFRFTYAAMAGVSYDISNNLKVDLGYKYRRISGGDMFNWDAFSANAGATGVQGKDPGFSSHEVKLGLRYELW